MDFRWVWPCHGGPSDSQTWALILRMRGGAKHSPPRDLTWEHQNPPEIIRNQWYWKWTRTRMRTSWRIKSHQKWHLTSRDVIKLNSKKSIITEISRVWQNRSGSHPSVLGFRTWGRHSWNLRWKDDGRNREIFIRIRFDFWTMDVRWLFPCCVRTPLLFRKDSGLPDRV